MWPTMLQIQSKITCRSDSLSGNVLSDPNRNQNEQIFRTEPEITVRLGLVLTKKPKYTYFIEFNHNSDSYPSMQVKLYKYLHTNFVTSRYNVNYMD